MTQIDLACTPQTAADSAKIVKKKKIDHLVKHLIFHLIPLEDESGGSSCSIVGDIHEMCAAGEALTDVMQLGMY